MRVFVAGATGAVGRPLVSTLLARGHHVTGMTHSRPGIEFLRRNGAGGVIVDAMDKEAVDAAVARARPDAVIDELTSMPKRYTPEELRTATERDHSLRLEGGANLLSAATANGVRRYVVQSSGF